MIVPFFKVFRTHKSQISKLAFISHHVEITNCVIADYVNLTHHSSILNSEIHQRTSIGRYSIIRNANIGAYCSISWFVSIGADHHPTERISGSAAFFQKRFGLRPDNVSKGEVPRTVIGNDVLIGCNTIIKAGVNIGDGAVIGSGSLVLHDVPPYAIVGGVPSRIIKMRFDEDTVRKLLDLEWWKFDDEIIKKNVTLFEKPLTVDAIEKLFELKDS